MTQTISKSQHLKMKNPFIQIFKYLYLSIKILKIVAGGHSGTRNQ